MNRPFVSIVLAYAAGLLLAQCVHLPLLGLFIISFSILLPMLVFKNLRALLIWPLLLFVGWANPRSTAWKRGTASSASARVKPAVAAISCKPPARSW
ncbi:MAG: hypothetical protein JF609_06055 [Verrucomicrobia bacterium]|nr:hypothetical protein [Verrucomicrobiota bacterium]